MDSLNERTQDIAEGLKVLGDQSFEYIEAGLSKIQNASVSDRMNLFAAFLSQPENQAQWKDLSKRSLEIVKECKERITSTVPTTVEDQLLSYIKNPNNGDIDRFKKAIELKNMPNCKNHAIEALVFLATDTDCSISRRKRAARLADDLGDNKTHFKDLCSNLLRHSILKPHQISSIIDDLVDIEVGDQFFFNLIKDETLKGSVRKHILDDLISIEVNEQELKKCGLLLAADTHIETDIRYSLMKEILPDLKVKDEDLIDSYLSLIHPASPPHIIKYSISGLLRSGINLHVLIAPVLSFIHCTSMDLDTKCWLAEFAIPSLKLHSSQLIEIYLNIAKNPKINNHYRNIMLDRLLGLGLMKELLIDVYMLALQGRDSPHNQYFRYRELIAMGSTLISSQNIYESLDDSVKSNIAHFHLKMMAHRFSVDSVGIGTYKKQLSGFKSTDTYREMKYSLDLLYDSQEKTLSTPQIANIINSYEQFEDRFSSSEIKMKIESGDLVVLPVSLVSRSGDFWKLGFSDFGHSVSLVFKRGVVALCNKGAYSRKSKYHNNLGNPVLAIELYKYNRDFFTIEFFNKIRSGDVDTWKSINSQSDYYIGSVSKKAQSTGNCSWTSCKMSLIAAMMLEKSGGKLLRRGSNTEDLYSDILHNYYSHFSFNDRVNAYNEYKLAPYADPEMIAIAGLKLLNLAFNRYSNETVNSMISIGRLPRIIDVYRAFLFDGGNKYDTSWMKNTLTNKKIRSIFV